MSINSENNSKIPGNLLLKAFRNMESLLGRPVIEILIGDLEKQGITFDENSTYLLKQIEDALMVHFSLETVILLILRLKLELKSSRSDLSGPSDPS